MFHGVCARSKGAKSAPGRDGKTTDRCSKKSSMKKYRHVINIGIQNNLTYRFNFLARTLFGFIPLIAMLYVWRAIFTSKGHGATVGTYTYAEMVSYYLLATI